MVDYDNETIYKHIINTQTNTEYVCVWGDNTEHIKDGIENLMFYTLCDLLSVDFDLLKCKLSKVTKKEHTIKVLSESHPLLIDVRLTDSIQIWHTHGYDTHPFTPIKRIADYIDRLPNLPVLRNPEIFSEFATFYGGTRIWNFSYEMDDRLRALYQQSVYDKDMKRYSVDTFIEHLKFAQILDNYSKYNIYSIMTDNIIEFMCSDIYYILSHDMVIKRCKNCGNFFVAYNRSDTLYCDRKSPQEPNWTCKEYSSKKGWYEKQRENDAAKLYRNIYQKKQMYLRRHPDLEKYKKEFEDFKTAAKEWKRNVKNGTAAESDYLQWLKEVK